VRFRRVAVPVAGVAIAIAIGVVGLASCSSGASTHDPYISAGKRHAAPALAGKDLNGEQVNIATSRGRITVVNFWASWCAPCRAESAALRSVALASPSVAFLGVDGDTSETNARSFVRDHQLPYPSVYDGRLNVATQWVVADYPQTFVVDDSGKVAARFFGGVTEQELTQMIHRVAASGAS
jgi:thiol-disulfide isomerase/thioredoxin